MRIAQVNATFPLSRGDRERLLPRHARSRAARSHDVQVFTMARDRVSTREVLDRMTVHRLRPLARLGNAGGAPRLTRALRGFDLIHLHYPFFGGEFATLAAKLGAPRWWSPISTTSS
ncbi:MAG: glycosyltransferase [Thermomicrobiales bacterium]